MKDQEIPAPVGVLFAHMDARAFGIACGAVFALWLFLATIVLVIRGGEVIGPTLGLLGQYFPGFNVTWAGAVIGACYAMVCGFIAGYSFAAVRNNLVRWYLIFIKRKARESAIGDLP